MSSRWPTLTNESIRDALTQDPTAGLVDIVRQDLSDRLTVTPRSSRSWMTWRLLPTAVAGRTSPSGGRTALSTLMACLVIVAILVTLMFVAGAIHHGPPIGIPGSIAYDSGGDIYVAPPDGGVSRQLTDDPAVDVQPTFSPDGKRVAFESLDVAAATVRLVLVDADGSNRIVVASVPAARRASGPAIGSYHVAWSPDGARLIFTASVDGASQLFMVDADGANAKEVGDPRLEGHDASWSPDGRSIAFVGGHFDPERAIYVMSADGSSPRPIGPGNGVGWGSDFQPPVWSPDGGLLAFSARINGSLLVFVDAVDGSPPRLVSADPSTDAWGVAWSPDGRRLAWQVGPHSPVAPGHVAIGSIDGSGVEVLAPEISGPPTWSPDGERLIGYGTDDANSRRTALIVIDIATGATTRIPAASNGDASWQWLAP